jgi:hypothetical protein
MNCSTWRSSVPSCIDGDDEAILSFQEYPAEFGGTLSIQ